MRNSTRDNVLHDDFLKRIEELEKQVQELKLSSQEQEVPKLHECKSPHGDLACVEVLYPKLNKNILKLLFEGNDYSLFLNTCPFCGYKCENK